MLSVPWDIWGNRAGTAARTSRCTPPALGPAVARQGVMARTAGLGRRRPRPAKVMIDIAEVAPGKG
jgi:hypothetical protein